MCRLLLRTDTATMKHLQPFRIKPTFWLHYKRRSVVIKGRGPREEGNQCGKTMLRVYGLGEAPFSSLTFIRLAPCANPIFWIILLPRSDLHLYLKRGSPKKELILIAPAPLWFVLKTNCPRERSRPRWFESWLLGIRKLFRIKLYNQ